MVAYFLISAMPAEGLDETVSSLRDIYLFNEESLHMAAPPEPPRRLGVGSVAAVTERAPFVVGP